MGLNKMLLIFFRARLKSDGAIIYFYALELLMDTSRNEPDKLLCRDGMSINDLRDIYYSEKKMTKSQRQALSNYDSYRLAVLKENELKASFRKKYMELQVMANLYPYKEFLKRKYTQ